MPENAVESQSVDVVLAPEDIPQRLIAYARQNPAALDRLFKELLIGVTSFFREPAEGQASSDVLQMAREGFRPEPATEGPFRDLVAILLAVVEETVSAQEDEPRESGEHIDGDRAELERELADTRERLQSTIEELESSKEEMQSLNEE